MKIIYKLNPLLKNKELDDIDSVKRIKIENALGRKFKDYQWIQYKQMVMPKSDKSRK